MKFFAALLMVSSLNVFAQNGFGQKDEPRCGEPCSHCAGGIKQCKNTRSDDVGRDKKDLNASGPKAPNGSRKGAVKQ